MDRTFAILVKNVALAKNGEEALRSYKTLKPDIILTDIRMDTMNGNEFIKELRKFDTKTPIIVISAFAQDLYEEHKTYVQAVVNKPINFITLVQTIDACLLNQ